MLLHSERFASKRAAMSREWHLKRDRAFRKKLAQTLQGGTRPMSVFTEPKIDCHVHVLDPVNFPYGKDIEYKPSGQEIGTPAQLAPGHADLRRHATRCWCSRIPATAATIPACSIPSRAATGRFKGIAIIDFDADLAALRDLQAQGIVGAAFNPTFHGIDYYKQSAG